MKEKILVVDDDKSMVNMIKDVLEMEGYAVTTAFDGEQALKQVQKQSDIILLDINLPKMDGIEVCEKIRDCVHCPILFLSARIEEKDRIIGLKAGGDDYSKAVFDWRITGPDRSPFKARGKNPRENRISI